MAKRSGFEHLKEDFPVFTIKNKTSIPRTLDLIGNEDIIIQGNAQADIASVDMFQMPNNMLFKLVSPTLQDLVSYGLITVTPPEPEKKTSEKKD